MVRGTGHREGWITAWPSSTPWEAGDLVAPIAASIFSSSARKSGSFGVAGAAGDPGRGVLCPTLGLASVEPVATLAVTAAVTTPAETRSKLRGCEAALRSIALVERLHDRAEV